MTRYDRWKLEHVMFVSFATLALACAAEDAEDTGPTAPCSEARPCLGLGAVCREGTCVFGGVYGDCMNDAAACGASSAALCLTSGPTRTSGYGVCSKECDDESDCWWALPDAQHRATCELFEVDGVGYCVIECGDDVCPSGMVCHEGICAFVSDGCGPTASPSGAHCVCDPGKQWCDPDPLVLDCCDIPGASGDGGGNGCCKTCSDSKPCGDSCIASHLTCNQPPGCACR